MKGEKEKGRKRTMGGRQGPFKAECREHAQEGLFMATAEDVNPKIRPVQMPEY